MTADSSLSKKKGSSNPITSFILSNLQGAIIVSVTGSLVLFGASTWNVWQLSQGFKSNIEKEFQLKDLSDKIIYYDEVLTMSARMSASTSNPRWEKRYKESEPYLIEAFEKVEKLVPEIVKAQMSQTDSANEQLIELEAQAFELVNQGKQKEAFELLLSPQYETQKRIYSQGIQTTIIEIDKVLLQLRDTYQSQLRNSLTFAGLSLPLLGFSIFVAAWLIRTYLNDRRGAERALQLSQQALLNTNGELEGKIEMIEEKTKQIQAQEQETALESELLQTDIGHLLDLISDLEAGDFTVEAEVSDRVTGLVSDTLNRLIENLSQTLEQVSSTAKTAAISSTKVKNYAENVAADVEEQAQGVNQMLSLTETVWQSSQNAIEKIEETQSILGEVKASVNHGQEAINDMNNGIEVLQTGSDRMVQRIKTLGEFVSLADQFVQEQNQTAAMTQVLALNASLVAAKAAEQRDPEQFQLVAREFESIANQVQQLAQQTNTGLESLQQRTTKIHGVVSDVDREVQGLNNLVSNFTQGVSDSSQAFSDVQTKTTEVEISGQAVEEGNMQIAQAAELTRTALQDMSQQADRTTTRMQSTLESSLQMKNIALSLIENIQVFSLPEKKVQAESSSSDHDIDEMDDDDITQLDYAPAPNSFTQTEESTEERELAQPSV